MNKESGSDASIAGPSGAVFISSDIETDSSNDNTFTVPAAKNLQTRKFCPVWLEDPAFKPWLQQLPSHPYKGKCSICNITINAVKSNLLRHANSHEHMKNMTYVKCSVASSTDEARSMDVGTESSSDNSFTVPTAKIGWKQTFLTDWLEDAAFKPWLKQVQGNAYKGKCSICNVTVKAKKSNLQEHAESQKHFNNMKYVKSSDECTSTNVASNTDVASSTDEARSMDVGTESSNDNNFTFTVPAAKNLQTRKFCPVWLEDPAFKPWLQQVQGNAYKGKCTFCNITVKAKKCNLQQHAESQKHIDNMLYGKSVAPGERTFVEEVKEAEIRVCTDAIEHNRPFYSFDHFVKMVQEAFKNPNVLKRMTLSRKKMKAITVNVINKSIVVKTKEKLQGKYFSLLIDETTDVSNMKLLCFLIRYVHNEQICTELLDLIRIKEATAEKLHQCLRDSLKKYNLPISDMVGFGVCVDNAYAMVGAHSSLASRLLADNGEICILPCICHSIDLAARHACECLPQHVEKFLHSLYSYFAQSPKRLSMLEGTQQFMTLRKQKVLQPSATRWLALAACITRVLEQWTVLFRVFAEASTEKDSDVANRIFTSSNCLFTKAYLQFMDYFLRIFTELNKLFQSSEVLVHRLLPECHKLLNLLGGHFIQSAHLNEPNIHKIDINNENNLLPLTTMFTGTACMNTLRQITNGSSEVNEQILQFHRNVQKCYKTGYKQIVDRVPFHDTFLNALDFLNPETALYRNKHKNDQLDCIVNKFNSKFNRTVINNEWYHVPFLFSDRQKETLKLMSLPQFWHEMSIVKDHNDKCILPNLSKLAQLCLSLPHSNADVERYFSTVTQIKSKGRSSLNPQTVAALTRIKLDMKSKNAHCYDYKVTDDMLKLFNDDMYNTEEIPEELIGSVLADESTTDSENH